MNRIIFDVDTQRDLFEKKCETVDHKIISNIESVLINALRCDIPIIGSVIAHTEEYLGYCIVGTEGQEKINETMMVDPNYYYNVANTKNGIDLNIAWDCWQVVFEKQTADIWDPLLGQPDNLQSLLRGDNIDIVTIIGNDFEESISLTIDGLLKAKYKVQLITNAVHNYDLQKHFISLVDAGVELLHSEDFIEQIKSEYNS